MGSICQSHNTHLLVVHTEVFVSEIDVHIVSMFMHFDGYVLDIFDGY